MTAPLLKWPGGKRWLSNKISIFLKNTFDRYIEPFLGGGAFLFSMEPLKAIVSDINYDLINCYKAIKIDGLRVHKEFLTLKNDISEYYYIRDNWEPKCEFQQAARFIYLMRHSWNGLYRVNKNNKFNVPYCKRDRKDNLTVEIFNNIQSILKNTQLECMDFEKIITKSDEGDFIFADPPYFHHNHRNFGKYNPISFSEIDQERLAIALKEAQKRGTTWILTNGSKERVLSLFSENYIFALPRHSPIAANPRARGIIYEYLVVSHSNKLKILHNFLINNYEQVKI